MQRTETDLVKFRGSFWQRLRGNRVPKPDNHGNAQPSADPAPDERAVRKSALADAVRTIVRAQDVLDAGSDAGKSAAAAPELIVCFDALTQMTSLSEYQSALDALTRHGVPMIVSGLDFPPMPGITHLHFFEALSTSPRNARLYRVSHRLVRWAERPGGDSIRFNFSARYRSENAPHCYRCFVDPALALRVDHSIARPLRIFPRSFAALY